MPRLRRRTAERTRAPHSTSESVHVRHLTGRTRPGGNPAETYLGKSQRNKGAGYEREVAQIISESLGHDFKRNIGQARDGGNDIDVGPLAVECKRRKTLGTVYGWLEQAAAAVDKRRTETVRGGQIYRGPHYATVIARQDQGDSIVIMYLPEFLDLVAEEVKHTLYWQESLGLELKAQELDRWG